MWYTELHFFVGCIICLLHTVRLRSNSGLFGWKAGYPSQKDTLFFPECLFAGQHVEKEKGFCLVINVNEL